MLMVSCGLRTIEVSLANVEDLRSVGDKTVLYVQGMGHTERSIFVLVPPKVEQAIRKLDLVQAYAIRMRISISCERIGNNC